MLKRAQLLTKPASANSAFLLGAILALGAISLLLAWVSTGFVSLQGWPSFLAGLFIAGVGLWLVGYLLRAEALPRWLIMLMLAAALLRLALGALWAVALPVGGWGSPAELGGYVMADAAERDRTAWELGKSDGSLLRAFQGFRRADQYGGLLFLSALVYRFLGGQTHQPLLMVVFTAAFSSLAVLFTWALTRRLFGELAAGWAAWGLALYPEAALLGSSQMREALLVTAIAAAFYGLVRYGQDHSRAGLAWVTGALLLSLPFSPPVAALLMAALVVQALFMPGLLSGQLLHRKRFWLVLAVLALAAAAGMWLSWREFAPEGVNNPLALFGWWLRKSAEWQMHLSERASGWIQKIFDETPDWLNVPLLLAYGVVQPFLPAALIDITSVPVWQGIAIWRSLGWTLLLPLLLYAPLRAFRKGGSGPARGLSLVVWGVILLASYRAGGDPWDNVRYRAAFAGLQVALVAWTIAEQRRSPDPWQRRILAGTVLILAWFLPWELRRYLHWPWPIESFYLTLGLGLLSAILYGVWDWRNIKRRT